MKNTLVFTLICLMTACIPDNVKKEMTEGLSGAHQMMAEMEFKKAIAEIELHKLRNGRYPNSLSELKFLSPMDSSMISNVDYTRLDSVYELNLKMEFVSLDEKETEPIKLQYPDEFWAGLGCAKSNVK
ncbi:MAG: hypothetical protein NVV82_13115 [Sporocytophaga sp.]|nr:hypothetical protein [Sporocytophaga sp.]